MSEELWWTVEAVLQLGRGPVAVLCAAEGETEEEAAYWAVQWWRSLYPESESVTVTDCYLIVEEEEL